MTSPSLVHAVLVLVLASQASELRAGDDTSRNGSRAPVFARELDADGTPVYRIYPLRNGVCGVHGEHAFRDNDGGAASHGYALYVWLVLGGERPIVIDAGLEDVAHMNEGARKVFSHPIVQEAGETSTAQLRKFGLTHADIGHVLVTHTHFDHVDEIFKYENATFHIGKREWEGITANNTRGSWCDGRVLFKLMRREWRARMKLVEDGEVLPGIEAFWVGGHTKGSMAYRINTAHGKVVLTGDTISLLENMTRPVGVYSSASEVDAAIETIRSKADIVLPSHDPATVDRWPPRPEGAPRYTIRAIRVGECEVTDEITFQDEWGDDKETRTYVLWVWVIEGGEKPIVVETGPNPLYVDEFNRSTARYIIGGLKQKPEENTIVALKRAGIDPERVGHVIATHCHADHYDYLSAFPDATYVFNRVEYEKHAAKFKPDVARAIRARPDSLRLAGDEEIVPGVRTVPLGCHTEGSQGVLVDTHAGKVLLCGDVVYMYQNIEEDRPGRSPSPDACREAMAKIRSLADIVLPAHDPLVLERWPGGIIGARLPDDPRLASPAEESRTARRARVLILGDSISIGYTPHVREMLADEADVFRPMRDETRPENCAGTIHGVASIDRWLEIAGGRWDVIHFNFGLHDIKRVHPESRRSSNDPKHPRQSEPDAYEKQLLEITARLKSTGAALIFGTTTPVPPGGVRPHRDVADPERYNAIARRVMAELGVTVNDLYGFAEPRLAEIQQRVNVHFTREGSRMLGERVTAAIREALRKRADVGR